MYHITEAQNPDELSWHPCRFCGKLTAYFSCEFNTWICADCLAKIKSPAQPMSKCQSGDDLSPSTFTTSYLN